VAINTVGGARLVGINAYISGLATTNIKDLVAQFMPVGQWINLNSEACHKALENLYQQMVFY
jgi:hypothetical protein